MHQPSEHTHAGAHHKPLDTFCASTAGRMELKTCSGWRMDGAGELASRFEGEGARKLNRVTPTLSQAGDAPNSTENCTNRRAQSWGYTAEQREYRGGLTSAPAVGDRNSRLTHHQADFRELLPCLFHNKLIYVADLLTGGIDTQKSGVTIPT